MAENKKDVVQIINLPDFSSIVGCTISGDNFTHLGIMFQRITSCGKPLGSVIMSRDVDVDCPECMAELRYRADHPDAAREQFGVVTHKKTGGK